jgi:hypothetical protein
LIELTQSMDHLKDKIDDLHQLATTHSGK